MERTFNRPFRVSGTQRVVDPAEMEAMLKKEAAYQKARDFFYTYAEGISFSIGGRVEDQDSLHLDAGQELRGLTLELMDAGLSTQDAIRNVRGNVNLGLDSVSATINAFGRILEDDREALIQERIDAEAATRSTLAQSPQV